MALIIRFIQIFIFIITPYFNSNDKEKNDYFAQTMKSLYKGKDNSKLLEIKGNETI